MRSLTVRAIGHAAHDALVASGGRLDSLRRVSNAAPYARASGEIVWIGQGDVAMHPRAVVLQHAARIAPGDRLDASALAAMASAAVAGRCERDGGAALGMRGTGAQAAASLRDPKGFAVMLAGALAASFRSIEPPRACTRLRARSKAATSAPSTRLRCRCSDWVRG